MTNQRGVLAIFYVVLLFIGAALGNAGSLPVIGGTTITPEYLWDLLLQIITPSILLIAMIKGVFDAINSRVYAEALSPGDLRPLLQLPEFWLSVVGAGVYIVQVFFKITLLDENTQGILANAILAVITQLLRSWGERAPGEEPIVVIGESGGETVG